MTSANADRLRYRLTKHAKKMMIERSIKIARIDQVLSHPSVVLRDKEEPALRHALGRIPELSDRILRVVYNESIVPWIVVTAFLDRKAGRWL